jgi:hypothetical protein
VTDWTIRVIVEPDFQQEWARLWEEHYIETYYHYQQLYASEVDCNLPISRTQPTEGGGADTDCLCEGATNLEISNVTVSLSDDPLASKDCSSSQPSPTVNRMSPAAHRASNSL